MLALGVLLAPLAIREDEQRSSAATPTCHSGPSGSRAAAPALLDALASTAVT